MKAPNRKIVEIGEEFNDWIAISQDWYDKEKRDCFKTDSCI